MIPQSFIQDLLARVDIVDVVGRHVQLKKGGQNFVGLCPFHSEKTPSFTVSPAKQFFHCFGCGAHGNAVGFLMDNRGLAYVDAIGELAQMAGMTVPEALPSERAGAAQARGLTDVLLQAAEFYRRQLKAHPPAIDYLKGRGITGATAARFSLGYAPDSWQSLRAVFPAYDDSRLGEAGLVITGDEGKRYDRFRGRVIFPIRNRRAAVIGFGARVLDDSEPKYLNSPETTVFRKGHELYGLCEAQEAIRRKRRAVVCEGYMDVIQLAQAGFDEAVAALGTAITSQHVETLFRVADHVFFAFDGDAAGRKAARRALEAALPVVGGTKRASFVLLPASHDPDSLIRAHGPAVFEEEISRSQPLSRWFVRALSEGRDLAVAEDCDALRAEAKPLLESMIPGSLRQQLVRELAEATRTAAVEIESKLKPWHRLPATRYGNRSPAAGVVLMPMRELKPQILRQLFAFPELAREFDAQIAAECQGGVDPIDNQITEVLRVSAVAKGPTSSGALVEILADSPYAQAYGALLQGDVLLNDDPEVARTELTGAFAKLRSQRVEAELGALLRQPDLNRERYRELSEERARLKESGTAAP